MTELDGSETTLDDRQSKMSEDILENEQLEELREELRECRKRLKSVTGKYERSELKYAETKINSGDLKLQMTSSRRKVTSLSSKLDKANQAITNQRIKIDRERILKNDSIKSQQLTISKLNRYIITIDKNIAKQDKLEDTIVKLAMENKELRKTVTMLTSEVQEGVKRIKQSAKDCEGMEKTITRLEGSIAERKESESLAKLRLKVETEKVLLEREKIKAEQKSAALKEKQEYARMNLENKFKLDEAKKRNAFELKQDELREKRQKFEDKKNNAFMMGNFGGGNPNLFASIRQQSAFGVQPPSNPYEYRHTYQSPPPTHQNYYGYPTPSPHVYPPPPPPPPHIPHYQHYEQYQQSTIQHPPNTAYIQRLEMDSYQAALQGDEEKSTTTDQNIDAM